MAETNWDITFIVRASAVNDALQKMKLPVFNPKPTDDGSSVTGTISGWKLVLSRPGKSFVANDLAAELIFELEMTDVDITSGFFGTQFSTPRVRAYIALGLSLVAQHQDDKTHQLVINDLPKMNVGSAQIFHWSVNPVDFKADQDGTADASFRAALGQWAEDNPKVFENVLAEIDIFTHQSGQHKWMQATAVDYVFATGAKEDLDQAGLGMLVMTNNRKPPPNKDIITLLDLPDKTQAAIHMSRNCFMEFAILPSLASFHGGLTAKDFSFDKVDGSISMTSGKVLSLGDKPVGPNEEDPESPYPSPSYLTRVDVQLLHDALEIQTSYRIDVLINRYEERSSSVPNHPYDNSGYFVFDYCTVTNDATSVFTADLDKTGGTTKLTLKKDDKRSDDGKPQAIAAPKSLAEEVATWIMTALEVVAFVIHPVFGAIVTLALTAATTAAEVSAAKSVQQHTKDADTFDLDDYVVALSQSWNGFDDFEITDAGFADGLVVAGKLKLT